MHFTLIVSKKFLTNNFQEILLKSIQKFLENREFLIVPSNISRNLSLSIIRNPPYLKAESAHLNPKKNLIQKQNSNGNFHSKKKENGERKRKERKRKRKRE